MNGVILYALVDPRQPNQYRYVGKTENLKARISRHIRDSLHANMPKDRWIRSLLVDGIKPIPIILKEVTLDNWKQEEIDLIKRIRLEGHDLTNLCIGGEGFDSNRARELAQRNWDNPSKRQEMMELRKSESYRSNLSKAKKEEFQDPDRKRRHMEQLSKYDFESIGRKGNKTIKAKYGKDPRSAKMKQLWKDGKIKPRKSSS